MVIYSKPTATEGDKMSEHINSGGPAFPIVNSEGFPTLIQNCDHTKLATGMTLRDYFAAKALSGMAAQYGAGNLWHMAKWSYELADLMLQAREA